MLSMGSLLEFQRKYFNVNKITKVLLGVTSNIAYNIGSNQNYNLIVIITKILYNWKKDF